MVFAQFMPSAVARWSERLRPQGHDAPESEGDSGDMFFLILLIGFSGRMIPLQKAFRGLRVHKMAGELPAPENRSRICRFLLGFGGEWR